MGVYFNPLMYQDQEAFAGIRDFAEAHTAWELVPVPDNNYQISQMLFPKDLKGLIGPGWKIAELKSRFPKLRLSGWMCNYPGVPGCFLEDETAGMRAAEHLLTLGLKNFLYVHALDHGMEDQRRAEGFQKTVEASGGQFRAFREGRRVKTQGWSLEREILDLKDFLRRCPLPLGVFSYVDVNAERVTLAAQLAGLGIPKDIALVSVSATPGFCELLSPSLTSVFLDPYEQGWTAAEVMRDQLTGQDIREIRRVPPGEVQARESTRRLFSEDELIQSATRWMNKNPPEDWSVAAICEGIHCNRMTLQRRFQKELGRSPHEEIMRRRLELARDKMMKTKDSVTTIALECGYTDSAHLTRLFKASHGVTPGAWRKRHARS